MSTTPKNTSKTDSKIGTKILGIAATGGVLALIAAAGWLVDRPAAARAAAVTDVPAAPAPSGGMSAEQLLGLRAQAARPPFAPGSPVVIVRSVGEFYSALVTLWSKGQVVPILIDDGSSASREDIARFVRGLGVAGTPAASPLLVWAGEAAKLPDAREARAEAMLASLHAIWGAASEAAYVAKLSSRETPGVPDAPKGPSGAVVFDPLDASAPAALALAAYYGQVLLPIGAPPSTPNDTWNVATVDGWSKAIMAQLDQHKLSYSRLGDQIDAITLVLNAPPRVQTAGEIPGAVPLVSKRDECLALTDLLGRAATGDHAARWAYCSQITGDASRAVYRAMSSMFLRSRRSSSALVIDTYETGGGWSDFDGRKTADALKPGITSPVGLIDTNRFSLDDWRSMTAGGLAKSRSAAVPAAQAGGGIEAAMITVTTMGNWDFFQLGPGNGEPGDIPMLRVPSCVYFVHSWSAQLGDRPDSVGGRWMDRGAYAYVGSVHEPYLAAFVPTPQFASRMVAGWPLSAAARHTSGLPAVPWRVQIYGDALMTMDTTKATPGKAATVEELTAALAGAGTLSRLDEATRADIRAKNFEPAVRSLVLQGRDGDAARVGRALLAEMSDKITPSLAECAALAAYRSGDGETFVALATRAVAGTKAGEHFGDTPSELADAIWQYLGARQSEWKPEHVRLLAATTRSWSLSRDVFEASRAINANGALGPAQQLVDAAMARTKRPEVLQRLKNARDMLK